MHHSQAHARRFVPLLAGLALLAWAGDASAQFGFHPMPEVPRAVGLRLDEATRVALATVTEVRADRVVLGSVVALRGDPGERFEIKRSPSDSPAFAVGERALFLLRGARSPYLLVDEKDELLRFGNESEEAYWIRAIRQVDAARGDLDRLRRIYVEWIDGPVPALRTAAVNAFQDVRRNGEAPPALTVERAGVALDGSRDIEVRRGSAMIALAQKEGTARLLAGLPGEGASADATLLEMTLPAAAMYQLPGAEAALLRALAHPRADIRTAGLKATRITWSEAIADVVAELRESDPDPQVRRLASNAKPPRRSR